MSLAAQAGLSITLGATSVQKKEHERLFLWQKCRVSPTLCTIYVTAGFISTTVMLDFTLEQELMSWNYCHQPKMTKKWHWILWDQQCCKSVSQQNLRSLWYEHCLIILVHSISERMTSLWGLQWAIAHVHILLPQSNSSFSSPFFFFHFTHRNNEEENLLLASTSNWQNENLSQTKRKDPHGVWVYSFCHIYSLEVSCDKIQKVALSLLLSRYTPYP